jgi:hypothetical protein
MYVTGHARSLVPRADAAEATRSADTYLPGLEIAPSAFRRQRGIESWSYLTALTIHCPGSGRHEPRSHVELDLRYLVSTVGDRQSGGRRVRVHYQFVTVSRTPGPCDLFISLGYK